MIVSAGGYFAGSLAVMTDAAHLLVDFLSFIISLLSLWLSSRPATHKLNYGWHRAGTLFTASLQKLRHKQFNSLFSSVFFICGHIFIYNFWLHLGNVIFKKKKKKD